MANSLLKRELNKVKACLPGIAKLTDEQLQAKTGEFKRRIAKGESLNKLLPEAFAVVCEADKRILGMRPYDVQIMGGIALHYAYLAEMNTGEGKTLTATLPLYLNGLTGKSTILVTANEYLAIRDAEEMGQVFRFLGLSVAAGVKRDSSERLTGKERKAIYASDIVYTTHSALGFDYLSNNLVRKAEDRFLREFYYVIIDEADAVLLDSATMPLVISGAPRVQSNLFQLSDFFVTTLEEDKDYEQEEGKGVWLLPDGVEYAEQFFDVDNFYAKKHFEVNRHVTLALKAHAQFERGKDYAVSENQEVDLLDSSTGRIMTGMKLRGGQHQALEAKEHVKLTSENRSMASVTYQNLFLMFPKMAGMSGTIADARRELRQVYKKKVVVIPPNEPMQRKDLPDRYFRDAADQFEAAQDAILRCHKIGRPVLVVTSSIADTELVSRGLVEQRIPHSVLNAKNAYWEAEIIKEAGQKGVITVSTSIAGRGTDIRLGPGVKELGGLAVIGVGRMSNLRQERQARGRSGRQGEPGTSQFFTCLEDDITEVLGEKIQEKYVEKGHRISDRKLRRLIDSAQKLREEQAVGSRQSSVDYDKILKRQRSIMYRARNDLLDGGTLSDEALSLLIRRNVANYLKKVKKPTERDLNRYVLDHLSYRLDQSQIRSLLGDRKHLQKNLAAYAEVLLKQKTAALGSKEKMGEFVRLCALEALDNAWIEQVDYLQQLQFVISGRSMAQRNPLFEYQQEAYSSFRQMLDTMYDDIGRNIFLGVPQYDRDGDMYIVFP